LNQAGLSATTPASPALSQRPPAVHEDLGWGGTGDHANPIQKGGAPSVTLDLPHQLRPCHPLRGRPCGEPAAGSRGRRRCRGRAWRGRRPCGVGTPGKTSRWSGELAAGRRGRLSCTCAALRGRRAFELGAPAAGGAFCRFVSSISRQGKNDQPRGTASTILGSSDLRQSLHLLVWHLLVGSKTLLNQTRELLIVLAVVLLHGRYRRPRWSVLRSSTGEIHFPLGPCMNYIPLSACRSSPHTTAPRPWHGRWSWC
jgi:hypothetical protein